MILDLQNAVNEAPTPFDGIRWIDFDISNEEVIFDDINVNPPKCFIGDVPLEKVIGFKSNYGGSWRENLFNLNRIDRSLRDLVKNPHYYTQPLNIREPSEFSFDECNGDYFVNCGKHRTTIARYFAHFNPKLFDEVPKLKSVYITHHNVDYLATQRLKEIRRQICQKRFSHLRLNVELGRYSHTCFRASIYNNASNRFLHFARSELHVLLRLLERDNVFSRLIGTSHERALKRGVWS